MRSFLADISRAFFAACVAVFRGKAIALASVSLIVATGSVNHTAHAQTAAVATGKCLMWINAATGKRLPTTPVGTPLVDQGGTGEANVSGQTHLTNGVNAFRDADGNWINSATGEYLPTTPVGTPLVDQGGTGEAHASGQTHLTNGVNAVRVPCPPPAKPVTATPPPEPPKVSSISPGWNGFYLGGELAKNSGSVRSTETMGATGAQTNQFTDTGDPIGVGLNAGYNFKLPNSNFVIGPFASADKLNQTINHTFASGSFLGTTTSSIVTVGAKAGVLTTPSILLYGIGTMSWLKEDLNINFVGRPYTSQSTTVRGFALGLGGEYQPSAFQSFGVPVSLFVQYQHTWWQDGNLNTPAASPAFNYAFKRNDDTIRFGVNFYFP